MSNLVSKVLPSIGGDFEINFDNKQIFNKSKRSYKPNYNKKYIYYTHCGRSAISLAITILKKKNNNLKVLLPLYCCKSVIQPFKENGMKILYYSMGQDLNSPNNLPENTNNTLLLFIHYFGKKNTSMLKFITKQKRISNNFFIIEDLVQTCLSKIYKNYVGDFLITSFRKFLPVPDGAILATDYLYNNNLLISDPDYLAKQILSKTLRKNNKFEKLYLNLYNESEKILDKKIELREISFFSKLLYQNLNINFIQKKRIINWKKIYLSFKKNKNEIQSLYTSIVKNEVPLAYPVLINPKKRRKFVNYLKKNRIYCAIHWNLEYKKNDKIFYDDYLISKSIVSIPLDHRIDEKKMQRLVKIINEF